MDEINTVCVCVCECVRRVINKIRGYNKKRSLINYHVHDSVCDLQIFSRPQSSTHRGCFRIADYVNPPSP